MLEPTSHFVEEQLNIIRQAIREIKENDPNAMLRVYLAVSCEFHEEDLPLPQAS